MFFVGLLCLAVLELASHEELDEAQDEDFEVKAWKLEGGNIRCKKNMFHAKLLLKNVATSQILPYFFPRRFDLT